MSNSEYRLIGRPAVSVVNGLGLYARSPQVAGIAAARSPSCTLVVACSRAVPGVPRVTMRRKSIAAIGCRHRRIGIGRACLLVLAACRPLFSAAISSSHLFSLITSAMCQSRAHPAYIGADQGSFAPCLRCQTGAASLQSAGAQATIHAVSTDLGAVSAIGGFLLGNVFGDQQAAKQFNAGMQVANVAMTAALMFSTGGLGVLAEGWWRDVEPRCSTEVCSAELRTRRGHRPQWFEFTDYRIAAKSYQSAPSNLA